MTKILIDEAVVGFEEWWSNEGSQAPKPTDDMYEHCKRMCEIAWRNGAYKALEQPAPAQEPVAWRVKWPAIGGGYKWLMVDRPLMEKEGFKNEALYTTPPAPAQPLTDEEIIKCWGQVSGTRHGYVAFANACIAAFCAKNGITSGKATQKGGA